MFDNFEAVKTVQEYFELWKQLYNERLSALQAAGQEPSSKNGFRLLTLDERDLLEELENELETYD